MSGRLSEKTKEKFIRTFKRLVEFNRARVDLMFEDEPDVTLQEQERRETLLLGQRGDFNYHWRLNLTLHRVRARLKWAGWEKLTENERSLVLDMAKLSELDARDFAERSLEVAERYFELGNQSREGENEG